MHVEGASDGIGGICSLGRVRGEAGDEYQGNEDFEIETHFEGGNHVTKSGALSRLVFVESLPKLAQRLGG